LLGQRNEALAPRTVEGERREIKIDANEIAGAEGDELTEAAVAREVSDRTPHLDRHQHVELDDRRGSDQAG
jgi:hypothetical protein